MIAEIQRCPTARRRRRWRRRLPAALAVPALAFMVAACGDGGSTHQAQPRSTARAATTTTLPSTTTVPPSTTTVPPTSTVPSTSGGTSSGNSGGGGGAETPDTTPASGEEVCATAMQAVGYLAQNGGSDDQLQAATTATLDACTRDQWLAAVGSSADAGVPVPAGKTAAQVLAESCAGENSAALACQGAN